MIFCNFCKNTFNSDEVFQRFGHFAASDCQMPGMQKVLDPVVISVASLRLRQLVIMVWKFEIDSARMNVHRFTHNVRRHY